MLRQFRRLYSYLWRYRIALLGGLICLFLANYIEVQVAILIGNGVDIASFDLGSFGGVQLAALQWFAVVSLGLGLCAGVLRYYMRDWIIGASRQIETRLRNDIFGHLLRHSPEFYDRFRTGDLMSRATSDVEAVRTVVGPSVMYMANTLIMLPLALYQMFHISVKLTVICFLPMVLIGPAFYLFKRGIHERYKRTQELMSDLSTNIQENLSGVRVIKIYAREAQQAAQFHEISLDYVTQNLRLAKLQSVFIPMLGLLVGFGVLALLWGGGWLITRGELTIGSLISFFMMLMQSVWPLVAFGWVLAQLERGAASLARIEEILDAPREIQNYTVDHESGGGKKRTLRGAIEFRHLTFTYPIGSRPALQDVTFSVPPGATLGLTGPVGCGKSTIAALLARRYNPRRGTVFIDGLDLLDWPVDELRQHIGIVDQEPFLFSDSIEANILFGVDGCALGVVPDIAREAAGVAQFGAEIEGFPLGYETLLGERGINLSGGQRQRAALARALARDPDLLILDDALAAVDTHTEEAILRGLRAMLGERTTLLISHRVSTMSLADVIVYLEEGRVLEMGTHEELLARRGAYWNLAQRQMLQEQIEETA